MELQVFKSNDALQYKVWKGVRKIEPCDKNLTSSMSSLFNYVKGLVTKHLPSCCSHMFYNLSCTIKLLRWKMLRLLYVFKRSIWYIYISFIFSSALNNKSSLICIDSIIYMLDMLLESLKLWQFFYLDWLKKKRRFQIHLKSHINTARFH
jgi:hypothetical protein